jgi:hypothetical protein
MEFPKTRAGFLDLFCFDRGALTVSGITIIRPIALILPYQRGAPLALGSGAYLLFIEKGGVRGGEGPESPHFIDGTF